MSWSILGLSIAEKGYPYIGHFIRILPDNIIQSLVKDVFHIESGDLGNSMEKINSDPNADLILRDIEDKFFKNLDDNQKNQITNTKPANTGAFVLAVIIIIGFIAITIIVFLTPELSEHVGVVLTAFVSLVTGLGGTFFGYIAKEKNYL